jgi:hypothetical protein
MLEMVVLVESMSKNREAEEELANTNTLSPQPHPASWLSKLRPTVDTVSEGLLFMSEPTPVFTKVHSSADRYPGLTLNSASYKTFITVAAKLSAKHPRERDASAAAASAYANVSAVVCVVSLRPVSSAFHKFDVSSSLQATPCVYISNDSATSANVCV